MVNNARLTWSLVHDGIAGTDLRFGHAGHQSGNLGEFGRGLALRFGRGRGQGLLFFLDDRLDVPETADKLCAATGEKTGACVLQFSGFHDFGVRRGRVQLQRQLWNLYLNFLNKHRNVRTIKIHTFLSILYIFLKFKVSFLIHTPTAFFFS